MRTIQLLPPYLRAMRRHTRNDPQSVLAAVLFGMSLGASFALGQSADGNVVGAVFDTSGGAVPAAEVELASNATGVKATTKTASRR